jgi:hypothetical protein
VLVDHRGARCRVPEPRHELSQRRSRLRLAFRPCGASQASATRDSPDALRARFQIRLKLLRRGVPPFGPTNTRLGATCNSGLFRSGRNDDGLLRASGGDRSWPAGRYRMPTAFIHELHFTNVSVETQHQAVWMGYREYSETPTCGIARSAGRICCHAGCRIRGSVGVLVGMEVAR